MSGFHNPWTFSRLNYELHPNPLEVSQQPSRWSSPWKHRDMKRRVCQPHHPSHGSCLASPRVQFGLETRYFYQIRCQSCSNVGSEDWIINKRTCAPPLSGCSDHCSIPCQPADLMRPKSYSEHSLSSAGPCAHFVHHCMHQPQHGQHFPIFLLTNSINFPPVYPLHTQIS